MEPSSNEKALPQPVPSMPMRERRVRRGSRHAPLDERLRALYRSVLEEPLPDDMLALVRPQDGAVSAVSPVMEREKQS